jgi:hypothetical protein
VSGGTLLLCVLYLTAGSPLPVSMTARVSAGRSVLDALDLLALRTGWTGSTGPVLMRWAVVPIGVLTLGQVLPWLRERASDSWRRVGIVACGLGTVILACSIGWSRGADFQHGVPPRYTTLFAPFFASLYMIWTMSATGWTRSVLQWSLLLGILSAIPAETSSALEYARSRKRASDDLIADADAGLDPMELARRHWRFFFTREDEFAEGLVRLRHLGFPPFRTPEIGPAEDPRSVQPFFLWSVSPVETISDQPILRRRVFGMSVVQVHAPAELVFQVPPGAHHAHGRFGIPPVAYSNPKRATTALRFTVEREDEAMRRTVDFLEQLDPGRSPADRGIRAFSIDLPSTGSERLILRVEPTTSGSDEWAWACWADLQFDADG